MTTPIKIKDLTHQAIGWLEAAYFRAHPVCSVSSANRVTNLNALVLPHREIATLSHTFANTAASLLASVVNHQAIELKIPTLLISSQPSLTPLAVNLVMWRAGIRLDAAIASAWTDSDFARLAVACGEVAQAPLFVTAEMPVAALKKTIGSAVADHGLRCVVVENPSPQSLGQWQQISRETGLPVTLISSAV